MLGGSSKAALAVALLAGSAAAIDLDIKDEKSIKDAAKTAASGAMTYYSNRDSDIPGNIEESVWEGSALFSVMMQYWSLTEDDSYNDAVTEGMNWMSGENDNYMPANYSMYMGNDDQLTWGLAAITAAELDFPQKNSSMPSWVTLAENVWNTASARWDTNNCDGGMRWQIWPYQAGYDIKNAISNGALFALSARLARFTKNETYTDWAEKVWDWSASTPLLEEKKWTIADTTTCKRNCSDHGDLQWSLNYGMYMSGAAYMYNLTDGKSKWRIGLSGLLDTSKEFFPEGHGNILSEITCEPTSRCGKSEILYKGLFAQDLGLIAQVAPYTESDIMPLLQGSASAAAKSCTGGKDNDLCGTKWYTSKYDGSKGLEQQVAATSIFVANLISFDQSAPATDATTKNNSSSGTTGESPSATTGSSGAAETSSGGGDGNGAGIIASGPVVLMSVMVMGILAIL